MPSVSALADFLRVFAAVRNGAGWTLVRCVARYDCACCQRVVEIVLVQQVAELVHWSWCRGSAIMPYCGAFQYRWAAQSHVWLYTGQVSM